MKVLFYCYEYPPLGGGVGNAAYHIFKQWSGKERVEVDVISYNTEFRFSIKKIAPNITLYRVPGRNRREKDLHSQRVVDMFFYLIESCLVTLGLMLKKNYDISHSFGYPGGIVSFVFGWKVPYVVSLRGIEVPGYNAKYSSWYKVYKPVAKMVWMKARGVSVNSKGLRALAIKTWPNLKAKEIVNGVDSELFQPAKVKEKVFTVTAGGTIMGKRKGLKYLIKGFSRLYKKYSKVKLVLIGDGDNKYELEQMANKMNLGKAVVFTGRKDRSWLSKHLPRFHIFCLPSLNEGMSNSALEAMACGLPILMTSVGGRGELVKENGLKIKSKNSYDIFLKLEKLYLNDNLRINMGRISRQMAEKMGWENVAEQYLNWYQECVA